MADFFEMMARRLQRPAASIAVYALIALLCGLAVVLLGLPVELLNILLAPIILASLIYPRWAYATMIALPACLMIGVAAVSAPNPSNENIGAFITFILTGGTTAELVHRLSHMRAAAIGNLRESESRFRALIENSSDICTVITSQGKIVYASPSVKRLLGYEPDILVGQNAFDNIHPDDRDRVMCDLALRLSRPVVSGTTDFRFRHSDGTWRMLETMGGSQVVSINGEHGIVVNARDITERVDAEAEIKRLYTETSDALVRERRYNDISRLVSSSLDLPTILRNVINITSELLNVNRPLIALLADDGESLVMSTTYNEPVENLGQVLPRGAGLTWRVMETGKSFLTDEYLQEAQSLSSLAQSGILAFMAVPIATGETRLGVMSIYSTTPERRFNERDLAVAETIGRQAGLAIQSARLLEDARRKAQEAETLRQAGAAVTSTLHLHETFERILRQLEHVVPHDSASIQLLKDGYLEIVGGRGWEDLSHIIGIRFPVPGNNPNTIVIQERRALAKDHVNFVNLWQASRIRSWMGVPLVIHDRVIGMLALDSGQPAHFNTEHIRLAGAFADQVAVAIENAALFEQVQRLARTDELTGLRNRRRFFELAAGDFDKACYEGYDLAVLMIDIDQFKRVNDTYGHGAGDEVLQAVAGRCRNAVRSGDIIARYGGEEFVALLPRIGLQEAHSVADRLCRSIASEHIHTQTIALRIAVSVGVAHGNGREAQLETMLVQADQALYAAKRAGGNQAVVWGPQYAEIWE